MKRTALIGFGLATSLALVVLAITAGKASQPATGRAVDPDKQAPSPNLEGVSNPAPATSATPAH